MIESAVRVGVLIVGSLYWDCACHRKTWRRDRLDQSRKRFVHVPIRYGRFSDKRKSYTMVFSTRLGAEEYGRAIVVPCRRRVRNAADVVDEAVRLWTAETSNGKNQGRRVSAKYGWGCVGLLPNPHSRLPTDLLDVWRQQVSDEPCYGRLKAADGEIAAVDESGLLTIPWPEPEDGSALQVDLLLATATCPTIENGCYPKPEEIADAWINRAENAEYFYKNRECSIETFQDADIEAKLKAGKLGA